MAYFCFIVRWNSRKDMIENWREIDDFPGYSVSNQGNIRSDRFGKIMALSENQFGLLQVGLMRDGEQWHRSVPLLVARTFITRQSRAFDTPINLDGDRHNNRVSNLVWRPRWFAIKYNQQFRFPPQDSIPVPLEDSRTGEVCDGSTACARRFGLLEDELVYSVMNNTYVWPTYQQFHVLGE